MAEVLIEIDVRSKQAEDDLNNLISAFNKSSESIDNTSKSMENLEKRTVKVTKRTKDLGNAQKIAADKADKFDKGIDGLDKAFNKSGIGGFIGDIKDVGSGLGAAAAGLGPLGIGIAALTAGIAAFAAASVIAIKAFDAIYSGIKNLTSAAIASTKELKHFNERLRIDDETLNSLKIADAGFKILDQSIMVIQSNIASALSPQLKSLGISFAALGLMAVDVGNYFIDALSSDGAAGRAFNSLINFAFKPMETSWKLLVASLVKGTEIILQAVGLDLPESVKALNREFENQLFKTNEITGGIQRLEFATKDYRKEAEKLLGEILKQTGAKSDSKDKIEEQTDAQEENTTATRDASAELSALNTIIEENVRLQNESLTNEQKIINSYDEKIEKLKEAANATRDNVVAQEAANKAIVALEEQKNGALNALAEKNNADQLKSKIDTVSAYANATVAVNQMNADIISAITDRMIGDDEKLTREKKKKLRAMAIAQKAIAVQNSIISTALSMTVTAAQLGFPAAIPFMIAAGAAGTAQTATILATPIPEFPTGGMISPDHQMVSAQPGEAILSKRAVRAMGEDAINDLNSGVSGSVGNQQIIVQMKYEHKIFNEFIADNIKRADSPLGRALRNK